MHTTLLLLSACLAADPDAAMKTLDVGDDAAAVSAVDRKGKPLSLAELQRGEKDEEVPVVLTFWCSFCHSCRHMEKDLDKLAAEYKGRAKVYAIDASYDTADLIDEAVKKAGLTLPILIDADGKIADLFGATKTTTTVILDAQGRVAYLGQFADKEHPYAREALDDLLAGRSVKTTHTTPKG